MVGRLVLIYCDYFWSNLPSLQHALYGGRCADGTDCGTSGLYLDPAPGFVSWTIGASYCDRFHNDSGGTYVAVGGWFCGNPVNFFGCFYYTMGELVALDIRLGACIVIHVAITQCMMASIEFVSVVTWMVEQLACLHMHVCGDLPMVLVLVITLGIPREHI